jgi:hypothetical protein|tara:strand:- start:2345 stop:2584 length:240 start_codon:yes stop_codon:yes gene_type:complete
MNDLELIPKIQKFLKTNVDNIAAAMIAGGIDNMEKYKYMLGQAFAYQVVLQEISNLLEPKEQNIDDDNIIELGKGSPKN